MTDRGTHIHAEDSLNEQGQPDVADILTLKLRCLILPTFFEGTQQSHQNI